MRSRFRRKPLFLLVALLAVFGILVALHQVYFNNPPPPGAPQPAKAESAISESAETEPILVEAFLPLGSGCMGPIVEHLHALEKRYPDRVKVVYTDFSRPEGLRAMKARGLDCLTILVNGDARFTVKNPDGTERKTWFNKPPEAGNWRISTRWLPV
ncbi:MAG: hypothetical protein ACLFWL_18935 [Candidatus Brocadiia bacterium]